MKAFESMLLTTAAPTATCRAATRAILVNCVPLPLAVCEKSMALLLIVLLWTVACGKTAAFFYNRWR